MVLTGGGACNSTDGTLLLTDGARNIYQLGLLNDHLCLATLNSKTKKNDDVELRSMPLQNSMIKPYTTQIALRCMLSLPPYPISDWNPI